MPRTVLLACALLLLITTPLAVGEDDPPNLIAPVAAAAVVSGQNAMIVWAPGAELPDTFNVYGIVNGSPVLLTTTPGNELSAEVQAPPNAPCVTVDPGIPPDVWVGCAGTVGPIYAVSATKGGIESPMTAALAVGTPCVLLDPDVPPTIWVGCTGGIVAKVTRPHVAFMLR